MKVTAMPSHHLPVRTLLLAAITLVVSACASTSAPGPYVPVSARPTTAQATPQATPQPTTPDNTYIGGVLTVGQQAFEASRVAVDKGSNTVVTAAAQSEMAEQQQLAKTLRQLMPVGSTIPALTPAQQQQLTALNGTSGRAFDRAYATFLLQNHDAQQALHETCITACTNPELQRLAGLALSQTRDHQRLLTLFRRSL